MNKIRIALADDTLRILNRFSQLLQEIPCVEVAFTATSYDNFFDQYEKDRNIDALILDIEMDSPKAGLLIAEEVCKPVLFTSSFADKHLNKIVELEEKTGISQPMPKELVTDPEKFRKMILRFCENVSRLKKGNGEMKVKTADGLHKTINVNNIILISAEKDVGNDKMIYFTEDEPITLPRTPFADIEGWNVQYNNLFRRVHKSYMVNKNRIVSESKDEVVVRGCLKDERGQLKRDFQKSIPVSENYRKNLK